MSGVQEAGLCVDSMESSSVARIAGVDPGSLRMGVAQIQFLRASPETVVGFSAAALTAQSKNSMGERLAELSRQMRTWLKDEPPEIVVLEKVFLGKNVQSAFTLGQSRGAALAVLGEFRIHTDEVAVRSARKAVCGRGEASKEDIRRSLEVLLGGKGRLDGLPLDASDALALAYFGWREHCLRMKMQMAQRRSIQKEAER